MTNYELLTLLLASVAAVISVVSLVRTRKVQEEQVRLEKITAELSHKQLQRMAEEDAEQLKARIHVTLERDGSNYRFWIRNHGRAKARDVWVTLDTVGSNPLVGSEYKDKIPVPFLGPEGELSLNAAITNGSSMNFKMSARWINEDGSQSREEFFLSV